MPSAQRVDDALSLDELLARIQRLYRELEALPYKHKPQSGGVDPQHPTYRAIEAQIHAYAQQVWALTE